MTFAASPSKTTAFSVSPRYDTRRPVPAPGAALLASRDLRSQLLLDAEQLARLEAVRMPRLELDERTAGQAVGKAVAATDPQQRFDAEQEMFAVVQNYLAQVEAAQGEVDGEVRKILTPDQYELLSQACGPRGGMMVIGGPSWARGAEIRAR